jgi:hypothetical protein
MLTGGGGGGGGLREMLAGPASEPEPDSPERQARLEHAAAARCASADDWEQAAEAWSRATELEPSSDEYWYYRGVANHKV